MADYIRPSFGSKKSRGDGRLTISPSDLQGRTRSVSEYDLPSVTYWKPEDDAFATPYYLNSALPVSTPELRIVVDIPPNSPPRRDSSLGQVDQSPLTSDATSEFEYSNNFVQRGSVFQPFRKTILGWDKLNAFVLSPEERLLFVKKSKLHPTFVSQPVRNVSGIAYPGDLIAVIGPASAGKTTLLKILSGQYSKRSLKVDGHIYVNNNTASILTLRSFAYIPSESLFGTYLTVQEHLTFHAYLRNEQRYSPAEKDALVLVMLKAVGLTSISDHRLNHDLCPLQLRLVSVATECLTNPAAIFLDEPLAGLDTEAAEHIGRLLKGMAIQGKIVMCSMTRPTSEVFGLFDHVALMYQSQMAFYGTTDAAGRFFASVLHVWPTAYNPADHYVRAVSTDAQKALAVCQQYTMSDVHNSIHRKLDHISRLAKVHSKAKRVGVSTQIKTTSWIFQLKILLQRDIRDLRRSMAQIKAQFVVYVCVAFVFGMVFLPQDYNDISGIENINGVIFLLALFLSWLPLCFIKSALFPPLSIYKSESRFKPMYHTSAFFISQVLLAIPQQTILSLTLVTICYWLVGLAPSALGYLTACGIAILIANVGFSFAFLMAVSLFERQKWRLPLSFLFGLSSTLLAGYLPRLQTLPHWLRPFSYLSWLRYGFQALMYSQWSGILRDGLKTFKAVCNDEECRAFLEEESYNTTTWAEKLTFVLRSYEIKIDVEMPEDNLSFNCGMLLLFACIIYLLAFLSLLRSVAR